MPNVILPSTTQKSMQYFFLFENSEPKIWKTSLSLKRKVLTPDMRINSLLLILEEKSAFYSVTNRRTDNQTSGSVFYKMTIKKLGFEDLLDHIQKSQDREASPGRAPQWRSLKTTGQWLQRRAILGWSQELCSTETAGRCYTLLCWRARRYQNQSPSHGRAGDLGQPT